MAPVIRYEYYSVIARAAAGVSHHLRCGSLLLDRGLKRLVLCLDIAASFNELPEYSRFCILTAPGAVANGGVSRVWSGSTGSPILSILCIDVDSQDS